MKKIVEQQDNVNDTCTDCGSFVDIGAVIDEHDTLLSLSIEGDDANEKAQQIAEKARQRFSHVEVNINEQQDKVELNLTFSVTVEKMLFQLENGL
ncbi:DUF406 family protein [Shewanella gaetbuli]|uniref:YfcZ/YiiS family protein n=1 Tax=Shewanella gaetbuli TaxID=220752 RepID=A0A9X2CLA0_9GAMM|nr:YfcZ/YiiS family protein [Shewanella gaetbuli]